MSRPSDFVWFDLISRMEIRFGVEFVTLPSGQGLTRIVDRVAHLFVLPRQLNRHAVMEEIEFVCDVLDIDIDRLLAD